MWTRLRSISKKTSTKIIFKFFRGGFKTCPFALPVTCKEEHLQSEAVRMASTVNINDMADVIMCYPAN